MQISSPPPKREQCQSKLTENESEEAATLAAREERTFDSEVEVSADLDSLAATEVARALLGNILCIKQVRCEEQC